MVKPSTDDPARLSLLFLAFLICTCGCDRSPPSMGATLDLAAELPMASIRRPTRVIELGRSEARRHLVRGWSLVDATIGDDGRNGRWSLGDFAEIEFFVARPADLDLVLRCRVIVRNVQPPFTLDLAVNGVSWSSVEIGPKLEEHRLRLPAELLREGQNRLLIRHPAGIDPRPAVDKDVRVLWDRLEFASAPGSETGSPFARPDGQTLFVPFDTRIDYFVEGAGGTLVAEQAEARGGSPGRLRVLWQTADGPQQVLADDFTTMPRLRLALPRSDDMRARLSLAAHPSAPSAVDGSAGIVLSRPRIHLLPPADSRPGRGRDRRRGTATSARPNIVFYLIDTLRADHLGCYGYHLATSPHIDRFARDGLLFEHAQAQSPWTRPSVASMFTGLLPQVHGVNDKPDALPDHTVTMAGLLRDAGYRTAAIVTNGNVHRHFGFARGFDHYGYLDPADYGGKPARSTDAHQEVLAWLDQLDAERPFFLFVHTVDPHLPYDPPEPLRSRLASSVDDVSIGSVEAMRQLDQAGARVPQERIDKVMALYDAEIAANDDSFGRLVEELDRRDLYRDSLVVLLSDHGEEFWEHGRMAHGKTLHAEVLDIPLIIKLPGNEGGGRRVPQIAQHVDLLPTVLELIGESVPAGTQGRSLMPLMETETASVGWQDSALSHLDLEGRTGTSLLTERFKVIVPAGRDRLDAFPELYDRRHDRRELSNIAAERAILAEFLAHRLRRLDAALAAEIGGEEIGDDELEEIADELRALGYIQ